MQPKVRFNHVALSLPRSVLDDEGRAEIADFYGDVFGMSEMPDDPSGQMDVGDAFVLRAADFEQFLFLIPSDEPMTAGVSEHAGVSVESKEMLLEMRRRALERAAADDRVEVDALEEFDFGPVRLTSFYVRFLLPVRLEVQHYDVDPEIADFFYDRAPAEG